MRNSVLLLNFPWPSDTAQLDKSKVLASFLFHFLTFKKADTDRQATGAIFRNLTTDQVGNIAILLPPLDVQRSTPISTGL